ncbi:glycosyltransferase family 9 protein [bacterium]|nr:glycosyltransferase family 9 protein [bacterium]
MTEDRILLVRPGALGDAIVTLPVLEALRAHDVVAVGHPVFQFNDSSAGWMAFDDTRLLGLFAEGGQCEAVAGFDVCVWVGRRRDPSVAASARRSGVGRFVFHPCDPPPGVHITDHLLGVLSELGVAEPVPEPRLHVRAEWVAARGGIDAPVVVHPGSGGAAKRWPLERFAELAARLGAPVVWVLGPAEEADGRAREVGERVATVVDGLSLDALSGLLAGCRLYVGNDSGVSHLAAALGAPTVAVFGATDPAVWGPRGERVTIVSGWGRGGLAAVSVDEALAASQSCGSW